MKEMEREKPSLQLGFIKVLCKYGFNQLIHLGENTKRCQNLNSRGWTDDDCKRKKEQKGNPALKELN